MPVANTQLIKQLIFSKPMFNNLSKATRSWLVLYFFLLSFYALISFGLTATNLTLINTAWFETFQTMMWQMLFNNRPFLTTVFAITFLLLFLCYFQLLSLFKTARHVSVKQQVLIILFLSAPLLLSYNALSRDVFNYIFNSRMVLKYQVNPHLQTAIEFTHDPWMRFMHNIHTSAPYGYGWTGISLLPCFFGVNKFIITWLNFRLFSLLSLILLSLALTKTYRFLNDKEVPFFNWALLFLNPLILLEMISNSHNDLWLMLPAIVGINFLLKARSSKQKIVNIFLSLLFLTISIYIKLATLALTPIFFIMILLLIWPKKFQFGKKEQMLLPLIASVLMFLPLLTSRSQQFHPWYLSWSLVFIPLIKNKTWQVLLVAFSVTSLMRYLPWLLHNNYASEVLHQQRMITWSALVVTLIYLAGQFLFRKYQDAKTS